MSKKPLKIAYFGTPDFSVPCLELLHNHPLVDLALVVSMPDRPAGRGKKLKSPPVIDYCQSAKIPYWQTENINKDQELVTKLKEQGVEAFIVLAFAQFLSKYFLSIPELGAFNIHTSILPKYRGAAPIQYALLNGDKETGVSIQKIVPQMDAGDLVYTKKISISPKETGGLLYTRLKFQAALGLSDFVELLYHDEFSPIPQDHEQATYAPSLKKSDGELNFQDRSSEELLNQIRALQPWPGCYTYLNRKRLKVFSAERSEKKLVPGNFQLSEHGALVGTKDTALLLTDVQLEGKKRLPGDKFASGLMGQNQNFHLEKPQKD